MRWIGRHHHKAPGRLPARQGLLGSLARMLFPDFCIHCGTPLQGGERHLCTHCLTSIPWNQYSHLPDNSTEMRLAGRFPFVAASSLMNFHKGQVSQSIIHHIKYYGKPKLGLQYGRLLGEELLASGRFDGIDCIIPVPLHWIRIMSRGYNQSLYICRGISEAMHLPIQSHNLYRRRYTATQTHKSREARQQNLEGVFAIRHPQQLAGKHVLLVDDIITTGATTANCCQALGAIPGLRVSIAALAIAQQT